MNSLKSAFDRAKAPTFGLAPLAIMFWIVAIDEDGQRREREKKSRRERQALAKPQRKVSPPRGPRPF